ncbi:hypothetical protein ACQ45_gp67 [Citrobacter phage Stevie]|uniref:Uncharacterized protein n=1 Tax=Citrobacter phage Stevie TaxID=2885922 RepID=A0A0A0YQQ7_9CAUD|nr:hypothetical protein ACQ45_gp67 [Citrobacter phage Stevie]AIX12336.1 hypothetical protein CPT_Stevie67 [Citrobacter phage Stevie]
MLSIEKSTSRSHLKIALTVKILHITVNTATAFGVAARKAVFHCNISLSCIMSITKAIVMC